MSDKKPIIIGIGSGRCGTVSLSKLLDIPHEPRPLLPWIVSDRLFKKHLPLLEAEGGAVALYYLNYIDKLFEEYGDRLKVVCLQRDVEKTTESFIRKTQGKNYWRDNINEWSDVFPYINNNIWGCISTYWHNYYTECFKLEKKYKNQFKIFHINELNCETGQKEIMNFCGVDRPFLPNAKFNITNFYNN